MAEKTVERQADLMGFLGEISFAPSCVDMEWLWDITPLYVDRADMDGNADLPCLDTPDLWGFNVRTTFKRPDTHTGAVTRGKGRWWAIELGTSRSGVLKTAWMACEQILKHELMEAFMVEGVRLFDPHASVDRLVTVNRTIKRG